jgi:hypothetical protein
VIAGAFRVPGKGRGISKDIRRQDTYFPFCRALRQREEHGLMALSSYLGPFRGRGYTPEPFLPSKRQTDESFGDRKFWGAQPPSEQQFVVVTNFRCLNRRVHSNPVPL